MAPAMAASLFDPGPNSNPANKRCPLHDSSCQPRQLFVRPPAPDINDSPLGNRTPKLILPRDLNNRSGNPSPLLLAPGGVSKRTRGPLACSQARLIIRHAGYRNIRTLKCGGRFHQFTARKRGAEYRVNLKVWARTGKIVVLARD